MSPVYPIQWQPLLKTGRYPHLAKRDAAVWERFLEKHGDDFDLVAYDVAVGGVRPADPDAAPQEILGFQYSTALKLDALLRAGSTWTIIEVRPEANVSAIGAVLCYQLTLRREVPEQADVRLGVVCEFLPPDIDFCAKALDIQTWIV